MNLLVLLAVAQLAERPIVVDNLISRDIEHNIRVVLGSNPGRRILDNIRSHVICYPPWSNGSDT